MAKICLIQMTSSASIDKSLQRADVLIREAAKGKPEAIFLPENFCALGSSHASEIATAESLAVPVGDGPVCSFISELALASGAWIFAGTMPLAVDAGGLPISDGRLRAASIVYDSLGQPRARYDKIHMFDADVADSQHRYRESETYEPGANIVCVDSPVGKVGLSVCYDLRFPELYRELFQREVDVLAVPSAFTQTTGQAHFEVLLRSRAIENTAFVVAACQTGTHDSGRKTHGHSMVINPWGEIIGCLPSGEGVLHTDINLADVQRIRGEMPFLSQARLLRDGYSPT